MKEIPKMLKKITERPSTLSWSGTQNVVTQLIILSNRVLVTKNQTFLIQIGLDILQSSIWLSI